MQNGLKSKVIGVALIAVMLLISSVSFCSLNWSYLIDCTNSLNEKTIGLFQDGLSCYGKTMVDPEYDARVIVYLQKLDSDGDWVNVTAWEDVDNEIAIVSEQYAVSDGTYRLHLVHRAYEPGERSIYLESFTNDSVEITID